MIFLSIVVAKDVHSPRDLVSRSQTRPVNEGGSGGLCTINLF